MRGLKIIFGYQIEVKPLKDKKAKTIFQGFSKTMG